MLKEYLLYANTHSASWSSSMPGVQSCRFQVCLTAAETLQEIPVQGEPLHFEAFFCLSGRLVVELRRIVMALMERIHSNYRFVIGFNGALIALGMAGVLPPAASATLHNLSTVGVSLRRMSRLTTHAQSV